MWTGHERSCPAIRPVMNLSHLISALRACTHLIPFPTHGERRWLSRRRRATVSLQRAVVAAFCEMLDFCTTFGFAYSVLVPAGLLITFLLDPTSDIWVANKALFMGVWFLYNFFGVGTSLRRFYLGTASYVKGWIQLSSVRTHTLPWRSPAVFSYVCRLV